MVFDSGFHLNQTIACHLISLKKRIEIRAEVFTSAPFVRPADCNSFLHCSKQASFIRPCVDRQKHPVSSRQNLAHRCWVVYIHGKKKNPEGIKDNYNQI